MKCPDCNRSILFVRIRSIFECPYCKTRIIVKNFKLALIVSLILFFVIGTAVVFISYISNSNLLNFILVIDMIVSPILAILIYEAILKGHRYQVNGQNTLNKKGDRLNYKSPN